MGKVEIEYKFPCGYEMKATMKSFLLKADIDISKENWMQGSVCPLHGKDCHGKKQ